MNWKNTHQDFGFIARGFHWAVAVLVLCLLIVGFTMKGLEASPAKISLYTLHKSVGTLVLGLMALRLLWRMASKRPLSLPSHAAWEKILATATHGLLYIALFAMPLSGWIMSSAGGHPYSFFGLFTMPVITGKDENLLALMRVVHEITAFTIIALVLLHVGGAFKHHFVDRDKTLQRMAGHWLGLKSGFVLALAVGLVAGSIGALAARYIIAKEDIAVPVQTTQETLQPAAEGWIIDHANSRIAFQATQYGETFDGYFENFDGTIIFNPEKLADSRADITIDIASIKTGSAERDGQALSAEWFDTQNFPQAKFVTTSFGKIDANRYVAHADLSIRGITKQVDLPFTLTFTENQAQMIGNLTLLRNDFGIGQGQWESGEAIGNTVIIMINVRATQQPPTASSVP